MDSELVLLVVYFDIYDNKQIDVSAECADKGINIFGSEVIINNNPDYMLF